MTEQENSTAPHVQSSERTGESSTLERLVFTVDEAALLLGVNRKVVYEAVRSGQIPARRIGKRRIVIVRAALLDWLSQGRVMPSELTD